MKFIAEKFEKAHSEGRKSLSEAEVYEIFERLELDVPKHCVISLSDAKKGAYPENLNSFSGDKIVLKVSSAKTLHKTEKGGVKVCLKEELAESLKEMAEKFDDADGILACEFIAHPVFAMGYEIMLGARLDNAFGAIISMGVGGTDAEHFTRSLKEGKSPSIKPCADFKTEKDYEEFLSQSWLWKYISGNVRGGKKLADESALIKWLKAFKKLAESFDDNSRLGWAIDEIEINPLALSGGKFYALDGVLRFRKAQQKTRLLPTARGIQSLLEPKTVAVAGVSESKMNMGRIILNNILQAGFPKEKLCVIKDYAGEIDGVKCFKTPKDLPFEIDMCVVAVPSPAVPELLEQCAMSGKIRGVVLISGGMGEKEGTEAVKDKVMEIIRKGKETNPDFTISGGNSLGIVSNPSKVNTLFIPKEKMTPPLGVNPNMAETAFISQSGAFVIVAESKMPWFKPAYSVTVGNQMDATVVDYVRYVADDDKTKVILAYMEGLKDGDGAHLAFAVGTAVKKGKKVIVYKAGKTPVGQKAVMGHTASIAGDFAVLRNVLTQAGALVCDSFEEFEDLAMLSALCPGTAKKGKTKTFILSNAGFEAAGMADNISENSPLLVSPFSDKLSVVVAGELKAHKLDGIVDAKNPLDVTPMAPDAATAGIADKVLSSGEYDAMVVSLVPLSALMKTLPTEELAGSVPAKLGEMSKKYGKPVIFVVAAGELYDAYRATALDNGIPVFSSCDRAVKMFSRLTAC